MLNLKSTISGPAALDLTRDNALMKEKFTAFVTACIDADSIMTEVANLEFTLGNSIKTLAQLGIDIDQSLKSSTSVWKAWLINPIVLRPASRETLKV